MNSSSVSSEINATDPVNGERASQREPFLSNRSIYTIYLLALATSIYCWLLPIRASLRIDETLAYWQISGGFRELWPRQFVAPSSPAYSYILWLWTRLFGTSETMLRMPSVLAMVGAVYLLYRAARELFDRDSALLAAVIFSLHPIILFASIDARPYAFAALMINAAIYVLLRLRNNDSIWLAALFGLLMGCIVCFQFLFATILPVLGFFAVKGRSGKAAWRQIGVAVVTLTLSILPTIPGFLALFRTSKTHAYDKAPNLIDLVWTMVPGWLLPIFVCFALIATFSNWQRHSRNHREKWQILLCASLALVPLFILYGVSVGTSIHIFATRYRIVSVPGLALCWGFVLKDFQSRTVRLLFCMLLVAVSALSLINSPYPTRHGDAWKYALEAVEQDASVDNAPVLVCSGLVESNFAIMPVESPKTSYLFSPLSYYPLTVPVVPLPQLLNDEAIKVGSRFLQEATQRHERFLAMEHIASYKTLDWITASASGAYTVRLLAVIDGFRILEFVPRDDVPKPKR